MKNDAYWIQRFEQMEAAVNKKAERNIISMERQFNAAQREIEEKIQVWYQRLAKNNNISMQEARRLLSSQELAEFKWDVKEYIKYGELNDMNQLWMTQLENASARYHISKLEAMKIQMQQSLEVLYGNQLDELDAFARSVYTEGYYQTLFEIQKGFNIGFDVSALDKNRIDKIIAKPWAADGRNFSTRIWDNKSKLINELHNELTQMVITGSSPDVAIKNIAKKMNAPKSNAISLVMTEASYFASASQKDAFNELDVEKFEIVATLDSSTSLICRTLDGKVFEMKDYQPGVTAPPFHVRCRSVTVPSFDDEFDLGERAARDENGQTYYVPSNMTYPEWEKTFLDGGNKTNVVPVDNSAPIKSRIAKKHERTFNGHEKADIYTDELQTILDGVTAADLLLYDRLSEHVKNNQYFSKSGAHYSPSSRMVKMNMQANSWEKKAETGRQGAWGTKFHEEFHQLDWLLANTRLAKDVDGNTYGFYTLTHTETIHGAKMLAAIQEDVLNMVNKAIDWENGRNGQSIKHLKSLDRISSDARLAFFRYLIDRFPDEKSRAQIALFSDAFGMVTKARLSPHNNRFWGHDNAYSKDGGFNGATSEVWAEFGSYKFVYDAETRTIIDELMPNTISTYEEVYQLVLDYIQTHELDYK
ncbi:minor capsid protein [Chryseomicrobium palamuruense]|uniref:Minor capsid protein n=1 Tax=Chryseomicrobium palamuruense TaxID=682973 RepID=A0ABV8UX70_9BACL